MNIIDDNDNTFWLKLKLQDYDKVLPFQKGQGKGCWEGG